jgi:hypothetical protein
MYPSEHDYATLTMEALGAVYKPAHLRVEL